MAGDETRCSLARLAAFTTPDRRHDMIAVDLSVDPDAPGGTTTITVTHYGALAGSANYVPLDRFTLRRPRADREQHDRAGQRAG